jgi:hypothetical protein
VVASDSHAAERRFVIFAPAGMVLPADAYRLWLDLQARGFTLTNEDGTLVVSPPERLSRQDCNDCRRWRWHLLMFIGQSDVPSVATIGPPSQAEGERPTCPHCDGPDVERLGHGWWHCSGCAREFQTTEASA